jgi:hypothetical protein
VVIAREQFLGKGCKNSGGIGCFLVYRQKLVRVMVKDKTVTQPGEKIDARPIATEVNSV